MPIYEYQCSKCGTFEVTQRITVKSLSRCPTCKGKVKKLISNTSFQLKGTGWYVTDYARKDQASTLSKNAKTAATESKSESKAESKAGASSDAKPSATSEKSETKTTSESASASS